MCLYELTVVKIALKTLTTASKESTGTVDNTCEGDLNSGGYGETRMFYVVHISGWDIILTNPALHDT